MLWMNFCQSMKIRISEQGGLLAAIIKSICSLRMHQANTTDTNHQKDQLMPVGMLSRSKRAMPRNIIAGVAQYPALFIALFCAATALHAQDTQTTIKVIAVPRRAPERHATLR